MPKSKEWLAVDGEGVTDSDERHRYVLLCASDGSSVYRDRGIPTVTCLDFLLRARIRHPKSVLVGFGLNYDVNMMLSDLDRDALAELWETGSVEWRYAGRRYGIDWIPSKLFAVSGSGTQIRLYDVWGFFQSSFLRALEDWKVATPEQIKEISDRKSERADFVL